MIVHRRKTPRWRLIKSLFSFSAAQLSCKKARRLARRCSYPAARRRKAERVKGRWLQLLGGAVQWCLPCPNAAPPPSHAPLHASLHARPSGCSNESRRFSFWQTMDQYSLVALLSSFVLSWYYSKGRGFVFSSRLWDQMWICVFCE